VSLADDYRARIERFNAGDLDGYLDFYADNVVFGGATPEPLDKAGVRGFHQGFVSAFPGTQAEILDLVESGDKLAARLALHVRHKAEFMGVPATGRDAVLPITTIFTIRDGRCVERWSTVDMFALMVQLGAIQTSPA
jgi:predicted ester cyclase